MSVELWNLTPSLLFFKQAIWLLFDIDEIEVNVNFAFPKCQNI